MSLALEEEIAILGYIPIQSNPEPLCDVGYHESKIAHALAFAPFFNRAEAWALSMYLGPKHYYQNINRALIGLPVDEGERDKFLLIAKAAQSALEKLPSVTPQALRAFPQPDISLPPADYLKRYVDYPSEVLEQYQVGQRRQEPSFLSTTYWQAPMGQMVQYAESANTVIHVRILAAESWGKYVNSIKRAAVEGEILFPPKTEFQVAQRQNDDYPINVDGTSRRMNIIHLSEVRRDADEREL